MVRLNGGSMGIFYRAKTLVRRVFQNPIFLNCWCVILGISVLLILLFLLVLTIQCDFLIMLEFLLPSQGRFAHMVALTIGSSLMLVLTTYQVVEKEIKGAVERLEKLEEDVCRGELPKKSAVIEAQVWLIKNLGTCRINRCILIRLPGVMIMWMVISLLLFPFSPIFVGLWFIAFMFFLFFTLLGMIIVLIAIRKWPETVFLEWFLEKYEKHLAR